MPTHTTLLWEEPSTWAKALEDLAPEICNATSVRKLEKAKPDFLPSDDLSWAQDLLPARLRAKFDLSEELLDRLTMHFTHYLSRCNAQINHKRLPRPINLVGQNRRPRTMAMNGLKNRDLCSGRLMRQLYRKIGCRAAQDIRNSTNAPLQWLSTGQESNTRNA